MTHALDFGRGLCNDAERASAREWLVTNGIGGYASGTLDGSLTRRYHGLLVAALQPPAGRVLLVAKFAESARYRGTATPLGVDRWRSGTLDARGALAIERFFLDGSVPVWQYAIGDALLEKRIVMERFVDATVVRYAFLRGTAPLELEIAALANDRGFHETTPGADRRFSLESVDGAVRVRPAAGDTQIWLRADGGTHVLGGEWYRDYDLPRERERGLDDRDAHVHAATFSVVLEPGDVLRVRAATGDAEADSFEGAFTSAADHDRDLVDTWLLAAGPAALSAPREIEQLVVAADAFIVQRDVSGHGFGHSIVAGYHWFGDWGRDAMIALPGLTIVTGRYPLARSILTTFARFLEDGLIPNYFPDTGDEREYNTVDASLWFVEAVRAYVAASDDASALDELFPAVRAILDAYATGTRFGIALDPADGLVRAGVPGVQLTWMDAKVGERVITPRYGKPVEINALWYNALAAAAHLAPRAGADGARYADLAQRARRGFARYAGGADGGLYDVLDGPAGNDASLRPNQIFAVSLHHSPLELAQQRAVVSAVQRSLLTSYGLRTLAPDDPAYIGRYGGPPEQRDAAYHQGTVWPWLAAPFALAHARAHGDRAAAREFLTPLLRQLGDYGVGTIGEIAEADVPFAPRGCIAQAWSVAEVLRAWHELA